MAPWFWGWKEHLRPAMFLQFRVWGLGFRVLTAWPEKPNSVHWTLKFRKNEAPYMARASQEPFSRPQPKGPNSQIEHTYPKWTLIQKLSIPSIWVLWTPIAPGRKERRWFLFGGALCGKSENQIARSIQDPKRCWSNYSNPAGCLTGC